MVVCTSVCVVVDRSVCGCVVIITMKASLLTDVSVVDSSVTEMFVWLLTDMSLWLWDRYVCDC